MAENLKGVNTFPHMHTFSIDTTTTQVQLPSECRFVKVGSEEKILYIAQNDATDGGALPTHRAFVPTNNFLELRLGIGLQRAKNIFVAAKTGTGTATIILEE